MAFAIEIPSIRGDVANSSLNLTVGGVRAYNLENLYSRKSEERFKLFIGFKNRGCLKLKGIFERNILVLVAKLGFYCIAKAME